MSCKQIFWVFLRSHFSFTPKCVCVCVYFFFGLNYCCEYTVGPYRGDIPKTLPHQCNLHNSGSLSCYGRRGPKRKQEAHVSPSLTTYRWQRHVCHGFCLFVCFLYGQVCLFTSMALWNNGDNNNNPKHRPLSPLLQFYQCCCQSILLTVMKMILATI